MSQRKKVFLIFFILIFAAAACSAPAAAPPAPTETPTATPAPTATTEATPEPSSTPEDTDLDSGGDAAGPGGGEDSSSVGGAAMLDPCLYGTWTIDNESMAQYLSNALNQNGQVDLFSITAVEGSMQLSFNPAGEMTMRSEDYFIQVSITLSEQVSMETNIILVASGTAEYQADGTYLTNRFADFEVSGLPMEGVLSAIGEGGDAVIIEVTPDWFLGTITEEDGSGGTGMYTCSDTTLALQTNEYGAVSMTRTE